MDNDYTDIKSNKRIVKNTGFLYFRMLISMAITLYTSRIVLQQLGVNDYGIYNVVGGVVMMFGLISASLTSSINRFISFELGKRENSNPFSVFSTSFWIQLSLSVIIVILIETVGVWFLNNKMVIQPARITAANWVLQFSALTLVVNMLSIPYNALIIAHERMQAFAYISLLEVVLKLGIAFLLYLSLFDNLIVYSGLLALTSILVRFSYSLYCNRNFPDYKVRFSPDRKILKNMVSYSSWMFIGSSSAILRDQGVNVILNLFCGTAVNAARAISMQVYNAVNNFSQNFMMAVNPQIIKLYAAGEMSDMLKLVFNSSRLSFYLLYCLSIPLILEMPLIINLWLTQIPPYTIIFARLILVFGLSESISIPLLFCNQASGKVKNYQLTVGVIQLLNFPIAYLLMKLGFPPYSVYIAAIVLSQICLGARLLILKKTIDFSIKEFLSSVYVKIFYVAVIGLIIPLCIKLFVSYNSTAFSFAEIFIAFVSSLLSILFIGLDSKERKGLKDFILKFIKK